MSQGNKLPPLPLVCCPDGQGLLYDPMAKGWQGGLPESTPHYLADKDAWFMSHDDWVLTQDRTTGTFQWVAPPKRKPLNWTVR